MLNKLCIQYSRWVKFEEDVEEGGERWSKPHVASLSLHSLFEIRKSIVSGTIVLDMDATTMQNVSGMYSTLNLLNVLIVFSMENILYIYYSSTLQVLYN